MRIEYLPDLTEGGKFTHVVSEALVRLYDFDTAQNILLINAITQQVLGARQPLTLASLPFIELVNCDLTLVLGAADQGLLPDAGNVAFTCCLTEDAYHQLVNMMRNVGDGHQWLSDVAGSGVDWLYSPGGTW